jgi:hypothetical protein
MPKLPSGLKLAISYDSLFDHGGNCFSCPSGHFWYWIADPEIMGAPPFDPDQEIILELAHASVPKDHEEVKNYIRVYQISEDNNFIWHGELLAGFPRWTKLDAADIEAWNAWLDTPERYEYFDEAIKECQRLAEMSETASGIMWLHDAKPLPSQ